MVPVRKFSTTTSLFAASRRRMSSPSGGLRFSVIDCLLRLTDMKYVASPPTKGGQRRVSSPFPGSSTLMISAPMSPRIIEQNGPASTRVRSSTRTPVSGLLARGTGPPSEHALDDAAGHRVHAVPGPARVPPEQTRAVERRQAREVVDVVDRLDGHARADPQPARLRSVAHEAGATLQRDQRDVQGRAEALRRRV